MPHGAIEVQAASGRQPVLRAVFKVQFQFPAQEEQELPAAVADVIGKRDIAKVELDGVTGKRMVPMRGRIHARTTDEAAGAQALLRINGWMKVFLSARAMEATLAEAQRWQREYGVSDETLDAAALRAAAPARPT